MGLNIHVRGVEEKLMQKLKMTAFTQNVSINSLILDVLAQSMGFNTSRKKQEIHHELDTLSGTWTKQDAKQFLKNTEHFEKIDEDLWK